MTTPKTEAVHIGDVLKWEVNPNFCRKKLVLKTSTVQSIEVGSPLDSHAGSQADDFILVVSGKEAEAEAIALEAVEAEGDEEIVCLVRGPALIDKDRLHLEASVTADGLEATLAALDIRYLAEPTEYEEGADG